MFDSQPVVPTTAGPVRGRAFADGRPAHFLGIPYARPPVGALRFMPPEPVLPWTGVRDAQAFGPAAAQVYDPHEAALDDYGVQAPADGSLPDWVGDEDCLTLNVWTPATGAPLRPVLVWIHGGANWLEGSRLGCYDGAALAQRGDAVVVSINYRLGLFGFLDLSVIGGERYQSSHSNGLRDQLLALQWVRDNIARFGGDPKCVTLAGESAGSMNIGWLAGGGHLQGLVQRVVLMSGVASVVGFGHDHQTSAHDEAEGQRRALAFLAALGLQRSQDLAAMPTAELLARHAAFARRSDMLFELDTLFYPRVDGRFARMTPFEGARTGLFDGLDVMIGFTAYEMGLWLQWDPQLDQGDTHAMAQRLPHFPAACRDGVAAFYDALYAHEPPGVRAMYLLADACFVMPSVLLAESLATRGARLWMYQFDWQAGDPHRRALHAADQGFFFGTLDSSGARLVIGAPRDAADAARRQALSGAMQDALLAFVRTGDPQHAGSAAWPAYAPRRSVMHLDAPACRVLDDALAPRWRWWKHNVFEPALPAAPA
jgi:para-nitrobenzyl esterase